MTGTVTWFSLVAAGLLLGAAIIDLALTWGAEKKTRQAVEAAVAVALSANATKATLEEHAGADLKGGWEALAALAAALKDLDRSTRLVTLSLAFLAVAAGAAGAGEIADAVAVP